MSTSQRRSSADAESPARRRLLDATVEIICNDGIGAVTSRAIASEAEENLGSITYYFGSKNDLVDEAMVLIATQLVQPVLDALTNPATSPTQSLFEAIPLMHRTLTDNREQVPAYLQCIASASVDASFAPTVAALHRSLHSAVADAIASHKASGVTADWVDPAAMAQVVVAVAHGIAMASAVDDETVDPTAAASQFAQLLLGARKGHGS